MFAPNYRWSNCYSPGSETQRYYEDVVEQYGLEKYLRLKHGPLALPACLFPNARSADNRWSCKPMVVLSTIILY
jgi:hypothetical protein